jgi:hypothetical protein
MDEIDERVASLCDAVVCEIVDESESGILNISELLRLLRALCFTCGPTVVEHVAEPHCLVKLIKWFVDDRVAYDIRGKRIVHCETPSEESLAEVFLYIARNSDQHVTEPDSPPPPTTLNGGRLVVNPRSMEAILSEGLLETLARQYPSILTTLLHHCCWNNFETSRHLVAYAAKRFIEFTKGRSRSPARRFLRMLHALLLIDDSLAEVRTSEILPIVVETMSSLVDRQASGDEALMFSISKMLLFLAVKSDAVRRYLAGSRPTWRDWVKLYRDERERRRWSYYDDRYDYGTRRGTGDPYGRHTGGGGGRAGGTRSGEDSAMPGWRGGGWY